MVSCDRLSDLLKVCVAYTGDVDTVAAIALGAGSCSEEMEHDLPAHLIEGGEVTVRAHRRDALLELIVENPCDPDRPPSRGAGVGLANVKARIDTLFAHRASVDVDAQPTWFRVAILLPAAQVVSENKTTAALAG